MKKFLLIICPLVMIIAFSFNIGTNRTFTKTVEYNGKKLLVSVDGVYSDKIPSSGNYYLTSYKCSNSATKVKWDNDKHILDFSNGNSTGGISCSLNFNSEMLISDVPVGSYVKYCLSDDPASCSVNNANYVDDNNMGYCGYSGSIYYKSDSDRKFTSNGFRIAYIEGSNVYLISAGAVDCVDYDSVLIDNLKKYCNSSLAYRGKCDSNSVWLINEHDFDKINSDKNSSKFKSFADCSSLTSNSLCGYNNELLDNGGYYWFNSSQEDSNYYWDADYRSVRSLKGSYKLGVRPVLKLSSLVYVTGGDGTSSNPYTIAKGSRVCDK